MKKLFFFLLLVLLTDGVNAQNFFVDTTKVDCTKKSTSTMFLLEGTRYENASTKQTLLPVRRLASDSISTLGKSLNSVLSQMTAGDCFVNFSVSPNAVCPFQAVTVELRDNLGNPLSTASGYSWILSTGQANIASVTLYPSNTMEISVTVQYWSGGQLICEQTLVRTIVVKPIPLVNLEVIPNAVCMGEAVQFTLTDMNHNPLLGWPSVWSTGQVNVNTVSFTPIVNTTVSVITTDPSSGCSTTLAREAIVYPKPWVMITPANPTLCGGSITLGVTLEVVGCPFIVWSDGTIGSTINVTSVDTYTVTVTDDNGCSGTATVNVTPGLAPSVNFTANVNNTTMTASFQNFSNGTSRIWNFGDGMTSTEFNPTHTYAFAGTYTVVLTESNGCGMAQYQKNIIIQQPILYPVAIFSSSVTSGCGPLVVQFTNASQNIQTSSWTFEGGIPSTFSGQNPPLVTFNGAGPHVVTLLVSNQNGSNSTSQTILVTGVAPVAKFLAIENLMNVLFVNQSQNATSYHWTFGDGGESFLPNPSHQYLNAQPYTVSLTAYNSCGSDTKLDTVYPICMNLQLGSTAPDEGIQIGDCIYLSAEALGTNGNVQFTWSPSGPLPNGPFGFEVVACPPKSMYFYVEAHNLETGCIAYDSVWVKVWGTTTDIYVPDSISQVKVYPNPADTEIHVEIPAGEYDIRFIDDVGQVLCHRKVTGDFSIPVVNIPAGNYLIHFSDQARLYTKWISVIH